ncbi:MAG: TonB-dependent receptor, partial [Blastocatellia bacterium]|nr:TonB-dependent receptor [Blastocatellia bacterium]
GVATVDTGNNGEMVAVVLDSIAEFKVLTSNYQAEYGRSAGAQISAVTKSGTNEFHGSFYVFRRMDGMNANTWLNNRDSTPEDPINKPRLDQRDIGYTIGGPVYIPKVFNKNKDKLFFFFSQEHQKRFTPPDSPTRVTVPTALERMGDFSQSVDGSGNPFPYIKNPFDPLKRACTPADTSGCFQDGGVLGRIPAQFLNPTGLAILKMYPMPNTTGTGFNYITEDSTSNPQRQDLYRGDWNISNNWRATGKFLYYKNGPTLPYGSFVLGTNMPEFPAIFPNNRYSVTGTVTGTINPTTVLEVTFGQSHNFIDILPNNPNFNRTDLGLSNIPLLNPGAVQLDLPPQFIFDGGRISNGPNIGSNNAPFHNFNTTRDWSVSLSKIHGSHNMKFGLFWQNSFKPQSSFANNNGQYNFVNDASNPLDTGFGFANAAVGVYNSFTQASGYFIGDYRYNNVEWYAQDNWKVTNRLTLDYGMRFYWIQPQFDELSQTANFLPDQFNPADAPLLFRPGLDASGNRVAVNPVTGEMSDSTNIGLLVPNTGNPMNGVFQAGQGIEQGLYKNRGVNFAPRFGFGYDVLGNQRLVVRGGAGVFYDRPQGNTVFDLLQNPPTTIQPTLVHGLMQNLGSGQALLAPPNLVAIDHEGKIPTTYAFNLGVQYKLPFDSVLDVSYVGTTGSHLLQRRNINAPPYGAAYLPQNQDPTLAPSDIPGQQTLPPDFLRPYQGYGNILYIEPAASSNYHSMQVSVNRRFSRGILLGVNYTWSKAMGTDTDDLPSFNSTGSPNNVDQRRVNYAPLNFNIPNNFNINWVWQMPKATQNRKLGYALNDWQLSGIYRYVTGLPYNVTFTIPGISDYTLTGTQQVEGARVALLG